MIDNLLHARGVIDSQIAHIWPGRRKIEKRNGDFSSRELVNQAQTDLRCHDCNAAYFVLHHSLGGAASATRIVVGIAQDGVVTELLRASFETLDYLGEEGIFNIRNDDSESAAVARCEMACVQIGNIPE